MPKENFQWMRTAFKLRGSVIQAIYQRVLGCILFGFVVSLLHYFRVSVSQPILGTVIPSIVLGLLLVFRTNTAYERFWEGRKSWGNIVNNIRNLARQIWVGVEEKKPSDREEKKAALDLLTAFAIATKLHLRNEPIDRDLENHLSLSRYLKLTTMNNPPLEIAFWIGDYLQEQYKHERLSQYQLISAQELLNNLVNNLGACERILRTPMPLAYSIHLKQLLLLYCLLLPFQLVQELGWWTGLIVGLISFTLFGIEAIGLEIENPFGYDANDIPLDTICTTIDRNIKDLTTLTPASRQLLESHRN